MKLSDIFKIKTNTGEGNKLFTRIMNKYNVPKKEYIKVKDELENFSGGGGSDSDVEYFKFNEPTSFGDASNIQLQIILSLAASTIKGITKENKVSIITVTTNRDYDQMNNPVAINTVSAFSYLPVDAYENLLNFTDLANLTLTNLGVNILETVTPITKEEFYDLNNI